MKIRRIKLDICQLKKQASREPPFFFFSTRFFLSFSFLLSLLFCSVQQQKQQRRSPPSPSARPVATICSFLSFIFAKQQQQQGSRLDSLSSPKTSTSRRFQAVQIAGKGLNSSFEPSILRFSLDFLIFNFRVLDAICSIQLQLSLIL